MEKLDELINTIIDEMIEDREAMFSKSFERKANSLKMLAETKEYLREYRTIEK